MGGCPSVGVCVSVRQFEGQKHRLEKHRKYEGQKQLSEQESEWQFENTESILMKKSAPNLLSVMRKFSKVYEGFKTHPHTAIAIKYIYKTRKYRVGHGRCQHPPPLLNRRYRPQNVFQKDPQIVVFLKKLQTRF